MGEIGYTFSQPHTKEVAATTAFLASHPEKGLTGSEVVRRQKQYGKNVIDVKTEESLFKIIINQLKSPLVWILFVAGSLAFFFDEWLEGIAIFIVIVFNSVLGFFMEWQALRSMEALRKLSQHSAKVIREGTLQIIPVSEMVPGDISFLEAGDIVGADGRIIEEHNLGVSEAALTGESVPVSKQTQILSQETILADQSNMLFKGTTIVRGTGKSIVIGTGKRTQIGLIAQLTQKAKKESTPLDKKLKALSQKLIWLTLILSIIITGLGIIQGRDLFLMIETAIALSIAAIPEGLPIVATIALGRGMLRLAHNQVIVKKLSSVETLGETQIIFTDKTGTLTENLLRPEIVHFEFGGGHLRFSERSWEFNDPTHNTLRNTFAFTQICKVASLCNNASLGNSVNDQIVGDPIEIALLEFTYGAGHDPNQFRNSFSRIEEIPFDSDTKMMATLHHQPHCVENLVCVKGALEVVLNESDYILTETGKKAFTNKATWIEKGERLSAAGQRLLGFAYSEVDSISKSFGDHLVFIGIIGFLDPPRKDIKASIQTCHSAGIRVIMVTGDHPETAKNIAIKTGLVDDGNATVIHGQTLTKKEDNGEEKMLKASIFARVTPAQKLQLINLYQNHNFTVGMTGDGINDTPALKKADIGIAMGKRGTEAAKEVADIVLKNDAFKSIVEAIKQGRGILENIRYFVVYLLSCNLSELMVVALAFFGNLATPLLPLQILFINMITDVFPALALGMNKIAPEVMKNPPRKKSDPIIPRALWKSIVMHAIGITVASLGALLFAQYYLGLDHQLANNISFYTLILAQMWHVFNMPETTKSFFKNEITTNRYIWGALFLCGFMIFLAYQLPILQEVLQLYPLPGIYWLYIFLFSLVPILFSQSLKRFRVIT